MSDGIRERYLRWGLEYLLLQHPGLRITPSSADVVILSGEIRFHMQGPQHGPIEDSYAIELRIPADFPHEVLTAREIGGRIPATFHKLEGDLLCLGSPTQIRLALARSPSLTTFVEKFVIPYLFGYSYFVKHGEMPFGELSHGLSGIREDFAELFGVPAAATDAFVHLASLKKRAANKYRCPCGSGRRLGRCHHGIVNRLRDRLGRWWFQVQYATMSKTQPKGLFHPSDVFKSSWSASRRASPRHSPK